MELPIKQLKFLTVYYLKYYSSCLSLNDNMSTIKLTYS